MFFVGFCERIVIKDASTEPFLHELPSYDISIDQNNQSIGYLAGSNLGRAQMYILRIVFRRVLHLLYLMFREVG